MRWSLLVVDHKLHAVKASQPTLSREPDIAVPGLKNGVDSILRKAAVGLPCAVTELAQVFLRIEAERQAGCKDHPRQQAGRATLKGRQASIEHPHSFSFGQLLPNTRRKSRVRGPVFASELPRALLEETPCDLFRNSCYRFILRVLCFWNLLVSARSDGYKEMLIPHPAANHLDDVAIRTSMPAHRRLVADGPQRHAAGRATGQIGLLHYNL